MSNPLTGGSTASTAENTLAARRAKHSVAAIRALRGIAVLEGLSYLVLLAGAMPLKYFADMPLPVRIVGSLHGGLFVLYVAAVAYVAILRRWPVLRWVENLAASVLPFGPFLVEPRLRREQEQIAATE